MADKLEELLRQLAGYTSIPISETHKRAIRLAAGLGDEITRLNAENAELVERIEATRRVIEFGYGRGINPLKNGEQCAHGRFEWQDCIGCYDEDLIAALDGDLITKASRDSGHETRT